MAFESPAGKIITTGDDQIADMDAFEIPTLVSIPTPPSGFARFRYDGTDLIMKRDNGVEVNVSAGGETLAQTLVLGASTGGTNLVISSGDTLDFTNGNTLSFSVAAIAGDVTLTLPDPGGVDSMVYVALAQTLTNKTLTTPTIGSFTNAGHSHQDAAGGGQLSITGATTGTLTETRGGTAQTTYAAGDILFSDSSDSLTKLTAGSDDQVLTLASGVPSWADAAGGAVPDPLLLSGGNVGAPTYSFTGDSNTGIFQSSTNRLELGVNGVRQILILSGSVIYRNRITQADGSASAPAYGFSDGTNMGMFRVTSDTLGFATNNTERMRFDPVGNMGFGVTNPGVAATSNAVRALHIGNGTAPVGALTGGGALFYATSGEMHVFDAAGNDTLISPHDENGEWIYESRNQETGKHLKIKMEAFVRAVQEKLGLNFIDEFVNN